MAQFKKSVVSVVKKDNILVAHTVDADETVAGAGSFSGDTLMIEEITIVVRATGPRPEANDNEEKVLGALDPLSQLLWSQSLRHMH